MNKEKTKISAQVVADSLSPQGDRLTSLLITFPRIILSELLTHRMLSKNTSSSRAIPFKKMVESVETNPFIPIAWQREHTGMQGSEYFTDEKQIQAKINCWLDARNSAVRSARYLNANLVVHEIEGEDFIVYNQFDEDSLEDIKAKGRLGETKVTKQLCNRLLEPFMWTTMLITGSREGWDNFFSLRCPSYRVGGKGDIASSTSVYKSKKDAIKDYPNSADEPEINWMYWNEGQAEIHMMMLSEKIYDCIQESVPTQLKENEWHIPMISDLESLKLSTDDQIKLSVGRAANTSYTVVGDGKELTLEHAIKIHDKCVELVHSSVFEHCARAMSDEEYKVFIKGKNIGTIAPYLFDDNSKGWCNNLKGFIPYRYFIDNKIEI